MPALKKLVVSRDRVYGLRTLINGPTNRLTFPTVTTLDVRGDDGTFPFRPPRLTKLKVHLSDLGHPMDKMDNLFRALKSCPLLEELEVEYNRGTTTVSASDTVHLPNLRFYSHSTRGKDHLDLFDKISFPPSCSWSSYTPETVGFIYGPVLTGLHAGRLSRRSRLFCTLPWEPRHPRRRGLMCRRAIHGEPLPSEAAAVASGGGIRILVPSSRHHEDGSIAISYILALAPNLVQYPSEGPGTNEWPCPM